MLLYQLNIKRTLYKSLFIYSTILLGIATGCSTKKNNLLTRTYHNITSQYNIYFNGNESYKKGTQKIDKLPDDYTSILSLYKGNTSEAVSAVSADMDRSIKKSEKIITKHSITVKPKYNPNTTNPRKKKLLQKKQYNKWVDDAYLIQGKALFQKNQFLKANEVFRFILKEYPNENVAIEANIWLVRSLILTKEYTEAEDILKNLAALPDFPKKLLSFFNAAYGELYIKKNQLDLAIVKMESALQYSRRKKDKLRFTFILAQLYQEKGLDDKALEAYKKVIKLNPPYEMTFNARVNMAGVFRSDYLSANEIRKQLNKLLKDIKNKDYQDQIYYALANIDEKEENFESALTNYKLSTLKSTSNTKQKVKSFLAIADIYYARKDYLKAASYFDSTMLLIDDTYNNYEVISSKANNLGKLQENLKKVAFEDSVQFIAKMSVNERNAFIDQIIEKVKEEEAEAIQLENERLQELQYNAQYPGQNNNTLQNQESQWYFYSPTAKSYGENEFKKKWGARKLEDNWRRSNKKTTDGESQEENLAESTDKKSKLSNKSREYYEVNIPLTDSALKVSHERIRDGLYNSGFIFYNSLNEPILATRQYDEIIQRYPSNPISADAAFQLYTIFLQLNNEGKALEYKTFINNNFPNTVFYNILNNPGYITELQTKEKEIANHYEKAYLLYQEENYSQAYEMSNYGMVNYSNHKLVPKYELIKSLSEGKLKNDETLRTLLIAYIKKYPYSDETKLAKEIVRHLDVESPEIKIAEDQQKAITLFNQKMDETHVFVISIDTRTAKASQSIFNLINYNLDHFSNSNLNVSSEKIDDNNSLIIVRSFVNGKEALNYYDSALKQKDLLTKDVGSGINYMYIISNSNLEILKKEKADIAYQNFFKSNYNR